MNIPQFIYPSCWWTGWLLWTALPWTLLHSVHTLVSKRRSIQERKRGSQGIRTPSVLLSDTKLSSSAAFSQVSLFWCSITSRDRCKTLDHTYYFKLLMFKFNWLPPPISGRHQVNKLPKRISELVYGLDDAKKSQVLFSLEWSQTWIWPFTS